MPYKVVYFDEAKLNVLLAKKWHRNQHEGLPGRFATAIKNAIIRIQQNPLAFAVRYKNIRIAHPDKFPFSIHFYIDAAADQIVITNIIHDHRELLSS